MRVSITALLETPIPERLARRPRDARGFPIPVTVLIKPDGTPDFRVTDVQRWARLVKGRICAMCGEPLGRHLAFIGGPRSHESRVFTDAAMHTDCASYAMAVCPFLALANSRHARKLPAIEGVTLRATDEAVIDRPEKMFIGVTTSYRPYRLEDGTLVVQAGPWERVEWHEPHQPG
jgi:hypothetical protein